VPRRRDQARSAVRSYKKQAAEKSGMHHVRAWWNRLPEPVRRFGPAILVLIVAVLYPYYLSSLPTGNTRDPSTGSNDRISGRPWGSRIVVTTPAGLCTAR